MWSDIFLVPFLCGLVLAVLLPLLGSYLRLRDEWLAALAYSHVAAAGALLASILGGAPVLGGMAVAGLAGLGKQTVARRLSGSASHALLLLGGWSIGILLTANYPMAERLGHALFDGQLYFSDLGQLGLVGLASMLGLIFLRLLSAPLLLSHLYPDFFRLRGQRSWPVHSGFDLLAALLLALATLSLGIMGAFALVFIPPWLAFRRARNWRLGLCFAVAIGVSSYVAAFGLALGFDQPFGPVLALLLLVLGVCIA